MLKSGVHELQEFTRIEDFLISYSIDNQNNKLV